MFYLKQHEIADSFSVFFLFSFSRIHYLDESKKIFSTLVQRVVFGTVLDLKRHQDWFYI